MRLSRKWLGSTLLELLVSLFLGSLVMLVLVAAYGELGSSSRVQREFLSLRSDLRGVHQAIRTELLKAGYRSEVQTPMQTVFTNDPPFFQGQYLWSTRVTTQRANQTLMVKTLGLRFQGDTIETEDGGRPMTDCLGNAVPEGEVVSMFFSWVQELPPEGSTQPPEPANLTCRSSLSVPPNIDQVFFSDVTHLEFHFGIDTDLNGEIDLEREQAVGIDRVLRVRTVVELAASEAISGGAENAPVARLEQVTNLRGPGL